MIAAPRRFRSLLVPVLVILVTSLVSTPALAGKKKAKQNPDLGGLYVPAGPVKKRGLVLENLDVPDPSTERTKLVSNASLVTDEPPPPLYHTPPIDGMRLRALFDWN